MEHKIFSIHDAKAFAYLPPFILPRKEMAMRTFSDCVNSNTHQFGVHPADYTLTELGTFDDSNAKITLHDVPLTMGTGLDFKTQLTDNLKFEGNTDGPINALSDDAPILPGAIRRNTP